MSSGYINLPGHVESINGSTEPSQEIVAGANISISSVDGVTTISAAGATGVDSFTIMQPDTGTAPTATSSNDTLTFHNTDGYLSISGDSTTKTLIFNLIAANLMLKSVYDTENQNTDIFNFATAMSIALG